MFQLDYTWNDSFLYNQVLKTLIPKKDCVGVQEIVQKMNKDTSL